MQKVSLERQLQRRQEQALQALLWIIMYRQTTFFERYLPPTPPTSPTLALYRCATPPSQAVRRDEMSWGGTLPVIDGLRGRDGDDEIGRTEETNDDYEIDKIGHTDEPDKPQTPPRPPPILPQPAHPERPRWPFLTTLSHSSNPPQVSPLSPTASPLNGTESPVSPLSPPWMSEAWFPPSIINEARTASFEAFLQGGQGPVVIPEWGIEIQKMADRPLEMRGLSGGSLEGADEAEAKRARGAVRKRVRRPPSVIGSPPRSYEIERSDASRSSSIASSTDSTTPLLLQGPDSEYPDSRTSAAASPDRTDSPAKSSIEHHSVATPSPEIDHSSTLPSQPSSVNEQGVHTRSFSVPTASSSRSSRSFASAKASLPDLEASATAVADSRLLKSRERFFGRRMNAVLADPTVATREPDRGLDPTQQARTSERSMSSSGQSSAGVRASSLHGCRDAVAEIAADSMLPNPNPNPPRVLSYSSAASVHRILHQGLPPPVRTSISPEHTPRTRMYPISLPPSSERRLDIRLLFSRRPSQTPRGFTTDDSDCCFSGDASRAPDDGSRTRRNISRAPIPFATMAPETSSPDHRRPSPGALPRRTAAPSPPSPTNPATHADPTPSAISNARFSAAAPSSSTSSPSLNRASPRAPRLSESRNLTPNKPPTNTPINETPRPASLRLPVKHDACHALLVLHLPTTLPQLIEKALTALRDEWPLDTSIEHTCAQRRAGRRVELRVFWRAELVGLEANTILTEENLVRVLGLMRMRGEGRVDVLEVLLG